MNKFIMIVKRIFVPNNADDTVTGKDKADAIEDIFGQENEFNVFYDNTSVFYRIVEFVLLAAFLFYFIFSFSFASFLVSFRYEKKKKRRFK